MPALNQTIAAVLCVRLRVAAQPRSAPRRARARARPAAASAQRRAASRRADARQSRRPTAHCAAPHSGADRRASATARRRLRTQTRRRRWPRRSSGTAIRLQKSVPIRLTIAVRAISCDFTSAPRPRFDEPARIRPRSEREAGRRRQPLLWHVPLATAAFRALPLLLMMPKSPLVFRSTFALLSLFFTTPPTQLENEQCGCCFERHNDHW